MAAFRSRVNRQGRLVIPAELREPVAAPSAAARARAVPLPVLVIGAAYWLDHRACAGAYRPGRRAMYLQGGDRLQGFGSTD